MKSDHIREKERTMKTYQIRDLKSEMVKTVYVHYLKDTFASIYLNVTTFS